MTSRSYDIVIWGATGFTGNLVASYFAKNVPLDQVKWAIAGRSVPKLAAIKSDLIEKDKSCKNVGIIVADAHDSTSLNAMTAQTRVVLSVAGPFMLYGMPLVESCVKTQTDYCDITGETPFVRALIDRFHDEAAKKGTTIVPMCGFDSIPSDLGVFYTVDAIRNAYGCPTSRVKTYALLSGGASGGTLASVLNILSNPEAAKQSRDPYELVPWKAGKPAKEQRPEDQDFRSLKYDKENGTWIYPFLMAAPNTRVVRRSAELFQKDDPNHAYSKKDDFNYQEVAEAKSFFGALFTMMGLIMFVILGLNSYTRGLLARMVPQPGTGPSEKQRAKSWFRHKVVGYSEEESPRKLVTIVKGGDPGYDETAKMISEAALCLANDKIPRRGGVLTPAASMGSVLVARLQNAGISFTPLVDRE